MIAAVLIACLAQAPEVAAAPAAPRGAAPRAAPPPGDPARGAALYETRCSACHSLDANRVGPSHRGVYGRKAGSAPGFAYTPALKNSGLVWNAANLDRWLAAPTSVVKGTAMGFRLTLPKDRADVIAYLASPPVAAKPKGSPRR